MSLVRNPNHHRSCDDCGETVGCGCTDYDGRGVHPMTCSEWDGRVCVEQTFEPCELEECVYGAGHESDHGILAPFSCPYCEFTTTGAAVLILHFEAHAEERAADLRRCAA